MQESVEWLVSQEDHPGLAESTFDVDLVAVVGGGSVISESVWSSHRGQTSKLGRCRSRKAHPLSCKEDGQGAAPGISQLVPTR